MAKGEARISLIAYLDLRNRLNSILVDTEKVKNNSATPEFVKAFMIGMQRDISMCQEIIKPELN